MSERGGMTTTAGAGSGGIALLGCGEAAGLHSRTLSRLEPGRPRFYASRDREKARGYADRLGGSAWFGTYEEALADDRVSTVLVLTPPATHLEWTLAALDAGKHVIVEKPAFPRSAEFDVVEAAADRAGRQVLVAENYAYKPLADDLRWLFEERPLGRMLFLHVNALKHQAVEGWRTDPAQAGGGALLEGGIHWVSLLAHLGPRVTSVKATSPGVSSAGERSIQLLLEYEQGTVASLSYSWEIPSPLKGLRLSRAYGTEGSVAFESNGLFFATLGAPWRLRVRAGDLLGYRAMFRDFMDSLAAGRPPRFTLAHARRDVELVEEAYRDAGLLTPERAAGVAKRRHPDHPDKESST